jgi:hypothetical protein
MDYNNNDSILVKNLNGTSADRYKIDGLHKKFMAAGGTSSDNCQVKGCSNPGQATAHVKMVDGRRSDDWLLTWVCASHNHHTNEEPYALRKNAKLVSVREVRALEA